MTTSMAKQIDPKIEASSKEPFETAHNGQKLEQSNSVSDGKDTTGAPEPADPARLNEIKAQISHTRSRQLTLEPGL